MNNEQYKKLVDSTTPKPNRLKNSAIAFLIGGGIGLSGQLVSRLLQSIFNLSLDAAVIWTIIIYIFLASLFTALRFFDNWVTFAKAGILIPITGFAHSMTSSALDYKQDGLITGLGSNFFKLAGSVLLFGSISAFILVVLRVVILWLV